LAILRKFRKEINDSNINASQKLMRDTIPGWAFALLHMSSRFDIPGFHLAVVTLAFGGGGPERDTVLLCNALAAKGVRVTILALREEGPLRSLVDPAIHVVIVPARRMRYAISGLRRAIRALRPAVVVSSGIPSLNLTTLAAVQTLPRGQRPKLVLREGAVPSMACHDPSRSNRIAYQILRHLYHRADRIITLTDGARRDLARIFSVPESRISVMGTNAVLPPAIVNWIAQWDGDRDRESDLIVCIGRLSAEKGQHTLLRAMTLLPPHRQWRLAIIGEGPDRATLEAFADSSGLSQRILFTGQVDDPFVWMRKARLAVCSSIYEGLGNAIIEALACGTPVVSTDCPYGPREILQGGRYGTLVPVGDSAAMAAAIEAALDRVPDRRSLMRRSLDYTVERAAARFLEIVADLEPTLTAPMHPINF
jgi:glycosyltransferase involved in cell wall biosynthesis